MENKNLFLVYLKYLVLLCFLFLLIIFAANLYLESRIKRTEWHNYLNYFKDIKNNKVDLAIIGTSRVDAFRMNSFGDPHVIDFNKQSDTFFNSLLNRYVVLTLYNSSFEEIVDGVVESKILQNANDVMVGVDFFSANAFFNSSDVYPTSSKSKFLIFYKTYFSIQNLWDKFTKKFASQTTKNLPSKDQDQWLDILTTRYLKKLHENNYSLNAIQFPLTSVSPFENSLNILLDKFKRGEAKKLILFTTPTSNLALLSIEQSGLWKNYIDWKMTLVTAVALTSKSLPPNKTIEIWDFDGFGCITTPNRDSGLNSFWSDIDHFHPPIAKAIINKAYLKIDADNIPPCKEYEFGTKLSDKNIKEELEKGTARMEAFKAQHPSSIERLNAIIHKDSSFKKELY